ncbi:hypothetical protein RE628_01365 [Paenibacillus sp. D2_2]|uniref:DUF6809 family protein n=1 Tax=Paenibacillus sp. D2_2 TaxID=3073092 RepID=UPI0028155FE4|nr:DUF6809 family protein [Paenibacillus sp. D2_2]WMT41274.1 hypothetical protein RE628_01365 [Paenibacillus sp. D2_2]
MPPLLESLYDGRLIAEEQVVPKDPKYRECSKRLSEAMEAWRRKMSAEEFAELEEVLDLQQEIQGMEMAAAFTYGFKLGALMIIEVHFGAGPEGPFKLNQSECLGKHRWGSPEDT